MKDTSRETWDNSREFEEQIDFSDLPFILRLHLQTWEGILVQRRKSALQRNFEFKKDR